jgi:long-chain acyl-CoA synthetase
LISDRAFIVRGDPALDAKTVCHFCRCELASYKVPRLVEFRDDLPKSNIGKVPRKDLR